MLWTHLEVLHSNSFLLFCLFASQYAMDCSWRAVKGELARKKATFPFGILPRVRWKHILVTYTKTVNEDVTCKIRWHSTVNMKVLVSRPLAKNRQFQHDCQMLLPWKSSNGTIEHDLLIPSIFNHPQRLDDQSRANIM